MLNSDTAVTLYERFAKNAPIYDYHCHLSAKEIYEDKKFNDITSIWLQFDHYKWRALRYAGVPEKYITGDAPGIDKFKMWGKTCGRLIGSPLYHWANMELQKYFDIKESLNEKNAAEIYNFCNRKIRSEELSPVKMISDSNVKLICTTDDPLDDLAYHKLIKEKGYTFKVLPTFRPDRAFKVTQPGYVEYLNELSEVSGTKVESYESFLEAMSKRIAYFKNAGCLLSDHSLEIVTATTQDDTEVSHIFDKVLSGYAVTFEEAEKFKNQTMVHLAGLYTKYGLVMQLHIGALRNNNLKMFEVLGADAGFDIMNDQSIAIPMSNLLGAMDVKDQLPKTILYTLNSKDNLVLSTLPHCFAVDATPGKIQHGAPWWFNDHKEGFMDHFQSIANQGMLADYIGMLTDSRSFLSYVRHDYFRRILCDYVGNLVETGQFDNDLDTLKDIVEGICYKNIINYLGVE
jgi:glucuronate isomerase